MIVEKAVIDFEQGYDEKYPKASLNSQPSTCLTLYTPNISGIIFQTLKIPKIKVYFLAFLEYV